MSTNYYIDEFYDEGDGGNSQWGPYGVFIFTTVEAANEWLLRHVTRVNEKNPELTVTFHEWDGQNKYGGMCCSIEDKTANEFGECYGIYRELRVCPVDVFDTPDVPDKYL